MAAPTTIDPRSAKPLVLNSQASGFAAAASQADANAAAAKASAASASPLANLNTAGAGALPPANPNISSRLLPPNLGGPPITPVAVPAPAPITTVGSAATTPASPVVVPPPQKTSTAQSTLGASLASFSSQLTALSDAATAAAGTPGSPDAGGTPAAPKSILRTTLDQFNALTAKLAGKGAATEKANDENDVAGKTQKVQDLTNDYNARAQYYDDKIKDAQTNNPEGKSAQAIQDEVDTITRQKNSELADIAIQQSAATGNLTVANTLAKQQVDAVYEPMQDELDNLKTAYSLESNDMTDSEKQQAQAVIDEKQSVLDEAKQKRLADYAEQIKVNDPKYQADLANDGSSGGTEDERQQSAIASFTKAFGIDDATGKPYTVPGTDGIPTTDENGNITPEAWKAAIASAPSEGLSREAFIKAFGAQIATPDGKVSSKFGLSPAETKLITGDLPTTT